MVDVLANSRITDLEDKVARLEKLVKILLYISKENEDFWPYTNEEERQLAADFYDSLR